MSSLLSNLSRTKSTELQKFTSRSDDDFSIALLDAFITFYQHTCFRVYGIALVERKRYIRIDRHRLPFLNTIEKINCTYCGYGNGVLAYAREVAARTEQYWCPIKHAMRTKDQHARTNTFIDYGDSEAWRTKLIPLRNALKEDSGTATAHTHKSDHVAK